MSEKSFFSLTFNSMESYHPEHVVYYKFLKNLKSMVYVFNFRYRFIARPRFIAKKLLDR